MKNLARNQNKISKLYSLSLEIAKKAHYGQKDKGGKDYIYHPLYVASLMQSDDEKVVALLHDVIEDSSMTLAELQRKNIPYHIIEAVKLLTKSKGVDYWEYLEIIKTNPLAKTVKLADLLHNSDISRLKNVSSEDYQRVEKYKKAMNFLQKE